jgi:carbonic anhydrase
MQSLPSLSFSALLRPVSLVVLMTAAAGVWADDWEKIVGDNGRTVEIDIHSIFNSDNHTKVSWGRVVLGNAETERSGYHTIKALNRYDCLHRSFVTIKRVYLDSNEDVVREEILPEQTPTLVRRNSVDERIWRKMCGLTPPSQAKAEDSGNATKRVDTVAAKAEQAARTPPIAHSTLARPAPVSVAPPPKLAPIPAAAPATVEAAPEKATVNKPPDIPAASVPEPAPAAVPPNDGRAGASLPADPRRIAARSENAPYPTTPLRAEPTPAAMPMKAPPVPAPPVAAVAHAAPTMTTRYEPLHAALHTRRPAPRAAPERAALQSAPGREGWSYHGEGGPDFWGRLRPEWKLCSEGTRQSPLDFAASAPVAVNLDPVKFDYHSTHFVITDTDTQLRVKVGSGMWMEVRGQRYALEGFMLHHPSETYIDGKAADMSVHFFHRDGEGRVAVLAVQVMRGDPPNALLQTLLNNLPLEKGSSYTPEITLDLGAFLPASPAHFLYLGSLTTPPCAEGVLWVVMKEPVTLSDEQYNIFVRLHASNARPVQPANARLVLESR